MKKNIGVKAFLKTMGLQKNLKTKQLDNRLLISLDDEGKTKLEEVWEQKYYGFASMLDLYSNLLATISILFYILIEVIAWYSPNFDFNACILFL